MFSTNMSMSMTPFLYETKTLCSIAWSSPNLMRGTQSMSITRRSFQSSARRSAAQRYYKPRNVASPNAEERDPSWRTRSQPKAPPKPKKDWKSRSASEHDIPFEVSNQSTSTYSEIDRPTFGRWGSVPVNEFGEVEDGVFSEQEQYDNIEGGEDSILYEDDGLTSMNPRGPRESTITDSEKRAFQRIFEEMFAQNRGESPATLSPQVTGSTPSSENARLKLDAILKAALEQNAQSRKEKEIVINRYPPALRASIAKAIGLTDDNTEAESWFEETVEEPEIDPYQLEMLREPERIRVETLMKGAETDFELWEIMKEEVFSLIPRLGIEGAPSTAELPTTSQPKKQKGRKTVQEPIPQDVEEEIAKFDTFVKHDATGAEVPALNVYAPLYPSYLLLGLRLLDRSFAKPSPLVLSILPKIKSMGPISQVLGGTTQLYNEVLRTYFYRYEDFRAIERTLKEMEYSAVELDEETLEIVTNIIKAQTRAARGDRGSVVKALWKMPKFTASNFLSWRRKITQAIAARNSGDKIAY